MVNTASQENQAPVRLDGSGGSDYSDTMAIHLKESGDARIVFADGRFSRIQLKRFVGGPVEIVSVSGGRVMAFHRPGCGCSLALNPSASKLARFPVFGAAVVASPHELPAVKDTCERQAI